MSNQYTALPVPVGNGAGAAVDMTTYGAQKTIVVTGTARSQINIEYNNDPGQAGSWQSLVTIQNAGMFTGVVACLWMRVRVSGYNVNVGGTSSVTVGGTDAGVVFTALPVVPGGNGAGAAVDVSVIEGTFKTVQIGGPFEGSVLVEISTDGSTEWATLFSFSQPGAQSASFIAKFMRTRRVGVPVINPGSPICNVGFGFETTGGGGGGGLPPDGDYGDVTVSGGGIVWDVNPLPESRITGLVADLAALAAGIAARVPLTRAINATAPLTIDGGASATLAADVTLAIDTAGLVPSTRTLQATDPLQIDGSNAPEDLSANRVLSVLDMSTTQRGVVIAGGAPSNVLRGDNTWSTIAQMTADLDLFTTTLRGLASPSGAAANFLRGDNTWSTVAQVTAGLDLFTTLLRGLVSPSAAAANFLRGDNTWSTPTQVTAALNAFTTTLQGLVGASGAAANFLRGDNTWSTVAQVTAALNTFTSVLQGLVPASGGGTTNFLRADGTWAAVSVPAFDTVLTPSAISFGSAFDNWNPGSFGQNTLVRASTDGSSRTVRGMVGGVNGITVTLMNVNASPSTTESWASEDAAATAANRFRTGFVSGGCTYYYDGTLSRWVLITGTP